MSQTLEEQFSKTKPGDVGIFGHPIEHSLSPLMQIAAFSELKDFFKKKGEPVPTYHKFLVRPDELSKALQLARDHRLRGLNVTVPHKQTTLDLVEELDPLAQKVRAINTVHFSKSSSKGFNTDAKGFQRSLLEDMKFDSKGKSVLVLGAGGTGQVISYVLHQLGAQVVYVWNRTPEKLKSFHHLGQSFNQSLRPLTQFAELTKALEDAALVVNATSVGLGSSDGWPVPHLKFRAGQFVFDVVYHRETKLLQEARKAGAQAMGGLGMLVYQGAESFEIWTGTPAPLDVMRRAVQNVLKEG